MTREINQHLSDTPNQYQVFLLQKCLLDCINKPYKLVHTEKESHYSGFSNDFTLWHFLKILQAVHILGPPLKQHFIECYCY